MKMNEFGPRGRAPRGSANADDPCWLGGVNPIPDKWKKMYI